MTVPARPGPTRVLVVEDSPTQAALARASLEELGYEVEAASDGAAGLRAALTGRFDIVLSDVVMPLMGGYELCRRFKGSELGRRTPVVLLTSLAEPIEIIRGLESGADKFLRKPYDSSLLHSCIEQLLEARDFRARSPAAGSTEVLFLGRTFTIASEREQILDLLLSTFEDAVIMNASLTTANRELTEQTERAQIATQAKSAFLANMSHELRTPLNAILGFSQLLEERVGASLEERQLVWLRNIQAAGTHLLALINDVLDISKVEAGRYEIRPEQITLADLLAPVLSTARRDAEARGLAFDASEAPATTALLDPLRTRQVLLNLLSNAVKFTERGGHVRLATEVAGQDLRFVVSDNGIGIPAGDQGRVFGVFERLHEERHEASGTGLGLALTKRIVELQGGHISFTSEEGVGTTFTVSIPGAVHAELLGPRVLIVEDDLRDSALIAVLVAEVGLPVEIAVTGSTALAAIRRDPPTAIVLDLRLPDMRGDAVLEALRADSATRRIPVIVVTVEDDEGRTRALGAADHLTKPIDTARLRRWLDLLADGQRGRV